MAISEKIEYLQEAGSIRFEINGEQMNSLSLKANLYWVTFTILSYQGILND